jgi:hypothetical protein
VGHWLEFWAGLTNASGPQYLFWSGIFADLTIFAAAVAVTFRAIHAYRAANCHIHHCWRVGRYEVAAGHFRTCRRHHPDPQVRAGLSAHHIHRKAAREQAEGPQGPQAT